MTEETIFDWRPPRPRVSTRKAKGRWELINGFGGSFPVIDWIASPGIRKNSPKNPRNPAALWDLITGLGGHTPVFDWFPVRRTGASVPVFTVAGQILALFQGAPSTATFTVAGKLTATFLGTNSPIVFWVKGQVAASFTGTNQGYTASNFTVAGQLNASFTQGIQQTFTVAGQVQASFFGIGGQDADCITGSPLSTLTPNSVH